MFLRDKSGLFSAIPSDLFVLDVCGLLASISSDERLSDVDP